MIDAIIVFFTLKYQRGLIMHKKHVPNAGPKKLSFLAKQDSINSGFGARHAIKLFFGKILTIKSTVKSIGLNYGLKKVTVSVKFANYPGTALPNLKASKNIGLTELLKSHRITSKLNMLSMMALIFIKTAALLIL